MDITETEKPYLELVKEIMLEMALRPIRIKRDKRGRIEIGVSVTQTVWVDCRTKPKLGVWNGHVVEDGKCTMADGTVYTVAEVARLYGQQFNLNKGKPITWVDFDSPEFGVKSKELIGHLDRVDRKKFVLQQQPHVVFGVGIYCSLFGSVAKMQVTARHMKTDSLLQYFFFFESARDHRQERVNPHMVALGRAYILGECPESVFVEALCEVEEDMRNLVYPEELD